MKLLILILTLSFTASAHVIAPSEYNEVYSFYTKEFVGKKGRIRNFRSPRHIDLSKFSKRLRKKPVVEVLKEMTLGLGKMKCTLIQRDATIQLQSVGYNDQNLLGSNDKIISSKIEYYRNKSKLTINTNQKGYSEHYNQYYKSDLKIEVIASRKRVQEIRLFNSHHKSDWSLAFICR